MVLGYAGCVSVACVSVRAWGRRTSPRAAAASAHACTRASSSGSRMPGRSLAIPRPAASGPSRQQRAPPPTARREANAFRALDPLLRSHASKRPAPPPREVLARGQRQRSQSPRALGRGDGGARRVAPPPRRPVLARFWCRACLFRRGAQCLGVRRRFESCLTRARGGADGPN